MRMSADSLAHFMQMAMNNGSNVVSARSIAESKLVVGGGLIQEFRLSEGGLPPRTFGLSWQWRHLADGRECWGHTGTLFGLRHAVVINEQNRLGVIILTIMAMQIFLATVRFNTIIFWKTFR
jgi:CubicO group peptidase (beta-lactamase class C family)